ncbi:MAG: hypothetical protein K2M12_07595 [Muribaculaceae bacterium]|nr:hypothetical protein [Muribaculaceae bacterium]
MSLLPAKIIGVLFLIVFLQQSMCGDNKKDVKDTAAQNTTEQVKSTNTRTKRGAGKSIKNDAHSATSSTSSSSDGAIAVDEFDITDTEDLEIDLTPASEESASVEPSVEPTPEIEDM